MARRRYGRFAVETSDEDLPLLPGSDLTKGDLIDYYESVWDVLRSHLRDRPLRPTAPPTEQAPQAGAPATPRDGAFPDFVTRLQVPAAPPGGRDLVIADKKATLTFLAQHGCIGIHAWLSRRDRLDHPDRLLVELLPPEEDAAAALREAARRCRELFDALGLPAFLATTGAEGLQVVVPLDREASFDAARAFAREAVALLAARHPDTLTTADPDGEARGRVRLDVQRNAWGRTAVAPYAVRARAEAPVATPVAWEELDRAAPRTWTIRNVGRRLTATGDPWAGIGRHASGLEGARRRLARLGG